MSVHTSEVMVGMCLVAGWEVAEIEGIGCEDEIGDRRRSLGWEKQSEGEREREKVGWRKPTRQTAASLPDERTSPPDNTLLLGLAPPSPA